MRLLVLNRQQPGMRRLDRKDREGQLRVTLGIARIFYDDHTRGGALGVNYRASNAQL